ncbi:efflux RND transporter periplasmic adaptor subunit [Phragmitibacter flavus]|uniref:Efflux RND transporter periplasmic adaptor subunit n=1 Tax=Phragmitibacter flavus TaxID=2576071 RepID=A0A5R8K7D1_9BACT|nr:efflux RND transporter periplasmic adaptor subunit [Phragmitibacter flavus]TLD68271.1 efflux RND transporter periplasmic adaptor subunit [Phragmitibacter flavus]
MKHSFIPLILISLLASASGQETEDGHDHDEDHDHASANIVVLDEIGVKNLRIETVEATETAFEQTVFALGHIEILPGKKAIVSSRIPGRAYSVLALPDQQVSQGEELMWVESRQPGDPPPTIMLEAPMDGLIAKVNIAIGQPIEPTQELIEIVNLETVEAAAQVPQHLAAQLKVGQPAKIRIQGFPEKTFEATLAHLGAYADEETGTIEAAFHVPNPDLLLRPGMRAEFSIIVNKRENVMTVPRSALQGDAISRHVYVKDFDLPNAFIKTPVEIGEMNQDVVEIFSGLFPADEVVSRGAYPLAFAGGGTMSLKEALDAAHGHEHNEDGSEKTADQTAAESGHDHGESNTFTPLTLFFAATTAILLVLLLISAARTTK